MAMRRGDERPGKLEILEQSPGKVVVNWELQFSKKDGEEIFKSTSFWLTDQSGDRHEWKFEYTSGSYVFHETRRYIVFDNLILNYCGKTKAGKSTFLVKFRITGFDKAGNKPGECYCDQTKSRKKPHNFSKMSHCAIDIGSIPIVKDDGFGIKIHCTVIASYDNNEKK